MKNLKILVSFFLLASVVFLSCDEEDDTCDEEQQEEQEFAFESVRSSGVSRVVEINGIKLLAVMNSPEEAISYGLDEESAYLMFAPGFNPCTTDFSIFGNVSCVGDDDCDLACVLKRWDYNTKSWITHGSGSAIAFAHHWQCFCE